MSHCRVRHYIAECKFWVLFSIFILITDNKNYTVFSIGIGISIIFEIVRYIASENIFTVFTLGFCFLNQLSIQTWTCATIIGTDLFVWIAIYCTGVWSIYAIRILNSDFCSSFTKVMINRVIIKIIGNLLTIEIILFISLMCIDNLIHINGNSIWFYIIRIRKILTLIAPYLLTVRFTFRITVNETKLINGFAVFNLSSNSCFTNNKALTVFKSYPSVSIIIDNFKIKSEECAVVFSTI